MINIKSQFPLNYYSARKVRISNEGKVIAKLGVNQQINLAAKPGTYTFRLDYHSSKVTFKDAEEKHIILYLKYRPRHLFWDTLVKNSLQAKVVSRDEFEAFGPDFYQEDERKSIKVSLPQKIALSLASLLSLSLIYLSIFNLNPEGERNFVFFMGIIGMVSMGRIWFSINKLYNKQFRNRIWAFSVACFVLLVYVDIPLKLKIALGSITLLVALLAPRDKSVSNI